MSPEGIDHCDKKDELCRLISKPKTALFSSQWVSPPHFSLFIPRHISNLYLTRKRITTKVAATRTALMQWKPEMIRTLSNFLVQFLKLLCIVQKGVVLGLKKFYDLINLIKHASNLFRFLPEPCTAVHVMTSLAIIITRTKSALNGIQRLIKTNVLCHLAELVNLGEHGWTFSKK